MSKQERTSWVSLAVTVLLGTWYFRHILGLPANTNLHSAAVAGLVGKLIVLSIALGIAGEIFLYWVSRRAGDVVDADRTSTDERDKLINLKAGRNAYIAMLVGTCITLGQIAMIELVQQALSAGKEGARPVADTVLEQLVIGPLSALHVAQLLILTLTLSSITVYISRIFYYRRGF